MVGQQAKKTVTLQNIIPKPKQLVYKWVPTGIPMPFLPLMQPMKPGPV
ncbi:hypothetical protein BvCmsKSNP073_03253 [Escherichia coli]|nr:hypothetical protein BvCmsKSNP073_03253 [Escherichia coli]